MQEKTINYCQGDRTNEFGVEFSGCKETKWKYMHLYNKAIKRHHYPLPCVEEIVTKLGKAKDCIIFIRCNRRLLVSATARKLKQINMF